MLLLRTNYVGNYSLRAEKIKSVVIVTSFVYWNLFFFKQQIQTFPNFKTCLTSTLAGVSKILDSSEVKWVWKTHSEILPCSSSVFFPNEAFSWFSCSLLQWKNWWSQLGEAQQLCCLSQFTVPCKYHAMDGLNQQELFSASAATSYALNTHTST